MACRTVLRPLHQRCALWIVQSSSTTTTAATLRSSTIGGSSRLSPTSLRFFSTSQGKTPDGTPSGRLLRRPAGYQGGGDETSPNDPSKAFGLRSNTVTLFPGDFRDHDNPWDDYDDNEMKSNSDTALFDDDGTQEMSAADLIQQALREKDAQTRAQKEKWIENAKPPVRKSQIDARGRSFGKGGRKAAKATVFITPGLGEIVVNRQDFIDYFVRRSDRDHILAPMVVTGTLGAWDVQIAVRGGGLTGQAGAARLGIANALNAYNPDLYRPALKRLGLLERDARKVERKKIGKVKARKSPQWVRR